VHHTLCTLNLGPVHPHLKEGKGYLGAISCLLRRREGRAFIARLKEVSGHVVRQKGLEHPQA